MVKTKLIKEFLFASFLFCVVPIVSYGGDNVPHELKAGEVISADVINEIFDTMDNVTTGFESSAELVGTWKYTVFNSSPTPAFLSYYAADSEGVIYTLEDIITFTDDGDGTYSYATAKYNIYDIGGALTTPETGIYSVRQSCLFVKITGSGSGNLSYLEKISSDKFVWRGATVQTGVVIFCERLNPPPAIPTDLTAADTGLEVTLTWTDNSTDESGFKVTRKDTLEGEFAEIGTTSADITTYADTLTQSGTYWYRVMATNQYGDSLGSNEAMITVSE